MHGYDGVLRRNFRNVEDVECVELRYADCLRGLWSALRRFFTAFRMTECSAGALLFALGGQ